MGVASVSASLHLEASVDRPNLNAALACAQSEDVGALKWQKAELESRNEMYQAQLMKAQMALERSDQDKAKLEQDLGAALAATAAGDKSVRHIAHCCRTFDDPASCCREPPPLGSWAGLCSATYAFMTGRS